MLVTLKKGSTEISVSSAILVQPIVTGWWISVPGQAGEWKILKVEEEHGARNTTVPI